MMRANQFIGMSILRSMTAGRLRDQQDALIVVSHSEPVAALVPYKLYLEWQEMLRAYAALAATEPK